MDSEAWNKRYAEAELLWSAGPNRFVEAEVGDMKPGSALDLAAGEGRNALWLAERGWQVTAVDFSSVALERGRRAAEARSVAVDFQQRDVTDWRPEAQRYDLVLVVYLHLPWESMERVLGAAATAVAPGGTLLVVGHDLENLERGHGGPQDPGVLYTPERVAGVLWELTVERAERVERTVDTPEGPRVAIDNLVRACRAHP